MIKSNEALVDKWCDNILAVPSVYAYILSEEFERQIIKPPSVAIMYGRIENMYGSLIAYFRTARSSCSYPKTKLIQHILIKTAVERNKLIPLPNTENLSAQYPNYIVELVQKNQAKPPTPVPILGNNAKLFINDEVMPAVNAANSCISIPTRENAMLESYERPSLIFLDDILSTHLTHKQKTLLTQPT